ncbi:MAG: class I SAM-dependent methyltransferase [Methanoregulaceae archaeon]|nr:class I SAM-dependent methyltransferase [Methanoregulaceae archaeon]
MDEWFNEAYKGVPPWDIGRPQGEFVRLEKSGAITGDVLDVGCGTGENALYLAGLGHVVWGVDAAINAIEKAKKKASERGMAATFAVRDALNLHLIGRTFHTVIDSGLFHVLTDIERPCFARNLSEVLVAGGHYSRAGTTICSAFPSTNPETSGPAASRRPK